MARSKKSDPRKIAARSRRRRLSRERLNGMVAEAIVDAGNESEEAVGLFTMMEEHLDLPFETTVLGAWVVVKRVNITVHDEIVAICARGSARQTIPILDLPLPSNPPAGAEWIEAYRHWCRGRPVGPGKFSRRFGRG